MRQLSGEAELTGDFMRLKIDDEGTAMIEFSEKSFGRTCGTCTLCCRLLPIDDIGKAAGKRCVHSRHHKGCSIYKDRPLSCRTWGCSWLVDPEATGLSRPDKAHYVVDMIPDSVVLTDTDTGVKTQLGVVQVWVDPAFPDAYLAPELREYMLMMATKYGAATIIRYNSRDAFVVFPPPLSSDGEWHEKGGDVVERNELEQRVLDMAREGAP